MRSVSVLLAIAVVSAVLGGCASGPADPWAGFVHPDVLAKAGLEYYWATDVSLEKGERITDIYRLDERVYCLTNQNRVLAYDANKGMFRWSFPIAGKDDKVFRPCHFDGMQLPAKVGGIEDVMHPERTPMMEPFDAVLFNTLSYVVVLNRVDGTPVRDIHQVEFDFPASDGGATDGTSFYVAQVDGRYNAVRLRDDVKLWWMYTKDQITAPIAYMNNRIYVASWDGGVYCTETGLPDGHNTWVRHTEHPIPGAMHVDSRGVFAPCMDNRLYAFDVTTGDPLWEPFIAAGQLSTAVQVGASSIYQYADGDTFYALDVSTGRKRWDMKSARLVLASFKGDTYLKDAGNNLLVVDEMLGTVKAKLPLLGYQLFVSNTTAPAVFAASAKGKLVCIRPSQEPVMTADSLRSSKPKKVGATSKPAIPTTAPAAPVAP